MGRQILKPSAELAPYVKYYWTLSDCAHQTQSRKQRIVPNGLPELTFYFEDIPDYSRQGQSIRSCSVLNGQQDRFYDVLVRGSLNMFSVVFQAWAVKLFFQVPASELYNINLPADTLLKAKVRELESRLAGSRAAEEKVIVVERFLMKQLSTHREYELMRICRSMAAINRSGGRAGVEELSSLACLSRKQFERCFREQVGISPKKFLKVVRFQYVLFRQQTSPANSLTELAYDCGYYDQSHMINDFKSLSGMTPKAYLAECPPASDYFAYP